MNAWPLFAWLVLMSSLAFLIFAIKFAIKKFSKPGRIVEDNITAARRRSKELSITPPQKPKDLEPTAIALEEHRRMVSKLHSTPTDIAGDTSAGNRARNPFNPSGQYNLPVRWNIDYIDQYEVITTRTIRVEHLRLRPPMVEAFCEWRNEYRTFYIAGIAKAVDPATGYEADVDSYVRHVRKKRAK